MNGNDIYIFKEMSCQILKFNKFNLKLRTIFALKLKYVEI